MATSRRSSQRAPGARVLKRQAESFDEAIAVLVAERARFHGFIAARIGNSAAAEDILQESLLRALGRKAGLRRHESAVAWFYRILRNAIADHYRRRGSESRRVEKYLAELETRGEDVTAPPGDWEVAVCECFLGLLPSLKPRHAQVIRRIDLNGEAKQKVASDLKITPGTLDVVLHRARRALRGRLEIFCGACSRERCLACWCQIKERPRKKTGAKA